MCAKRAHARARARACVHARTYKKIFFFQKKLQNFFSPCVHVTARTRVTALAHARVRAYTCAHAYKKN